MLKIKGLVIFLGLIFILALQTEAQTDVKNRQAVITPTKDTLPVRDTVLPQDSLILLQDSILTDSIAGLDSLKTAEGEQLTEKVIFSASDSMHIDLEHKQLRMFGESTLETSEMNLTSHYVKISLDSNEILAELVKDTITGQEFRPVFSDGEQEYTARKMRYNFRTRKGLVYDVITTQEQGFLHGERVKIYPNKEIHILHGKFTTCNKPHPHFYIDLTKAKVLPKHWIVTGPFFLVIADVKLPVGLPYGFFPNSKRSTTGIIFPQPTEEKFRGFGLTNGGYYWAINDYTDMKFTADIFTTGSWTGRYYWRFVKRYKFNTRLGFEYSHIRNGEKILPDFSIQNTFNFQFAYSQDRTARPNSNFSANINFIKGNHRQYNAENIEQFTNNTTTSSVSYQKTFAGTPFNMTVNFNSTQNLSDSTIDIRFPTINLSMRRIYPFKGLAKVSKNAWYEKIGVSMNSSFLNSVFTRDTVLYRHPDSLLKLMKNGFKYSLQSNTSFRLFKYFNLTPSFNYNGRVYSHKVEKRLYTTDDTSFYKIDTIWGLSHNFDFSFSTSLSTTLYGLFPVKIGKIKAIRHVMRPSVSYKISPDFSKDFWGFYYTDPEDSTGTRRLSYFADGIFGSPSQTANQTLSFSLSNNFEMKVASKDTSGKQTDKKIKIFDQLNIGANYNFAKDTMKLSVINLNASATPVKNTRIGLSASFSPYAYNPETGKSINKFLFQTKQGIARLRSLNLTFGTAFRSDDFKNGKKSPSLQNENAVAQEYNFSPTWNVSLNYSLTMTETFDPTQKIMTYRFSQYVRGSLNMTLTKNLDFRVSTGYDFVQNKMTSTEINIHRDLHCWDMSLNVIPFGRMKSYRFTIQAKSSIFEVLKFQRYRSYLDNF